MSYCISTRTEILGVLSCTSPLHVGGWESSAGVDLAVARDGTGRPCIPGTSLAGPLRAYYANLHPDLCDLLFGHIEPGTREGGAPSCVRIDDAHLIGQDVVEQVRDGVGIDRRSASAAANFLYTRQMLPAGTKFAFRMVVDTPTSALDKDYPGGWPALLQQTVDDLIAGLAHGRVPIGAGRGRGQGTVHLTDITTRTADLSTPDGLVSWLTGAAVATPVAERQAPADGRLLVTIDWRPVSPVLVRDSLSGTVVDSIPLTDTRADGTVRLLLPGSSIRGTVRSHAERIVRTLTDQDAPERFGDALRQSLPGVDVLFGVAPPGARADPGASGAQRARRGALTVQDCHSTESVCAKDWLEVVTSRPQAVPLSEERRQDRGLRNNERAAARAKLRTKLNGLSFSLSISDHVAIDRWTGGAGDHRLFSVLDPATTVRWEPIQLSLDTVHLGRAGTPHHLDPTALALPLLLLVLRDLRDGWLALGYAGTRGRGHVEISEIRFTGDCLPPGWRSLAGRTLDSVLADPPPEVMDYLAQWARFFDRSAGDPPAQQGNEVTV